MRGSHPHRLAHMVRQAHHEREEGAHHERGECPLTLSEPSYPLTLSLSKGLCGAFTLTPTLSHRGRGGKGRGGSENPPLPLWSGTPLPLLLVRGHVHDAGGVAGVGRPAAAVVLQAAVGYGPARRRGGRDGLVVRRGALPRVELPLAGVRRGHDHEVGGARQEVAARGAGVGVESRRVRVRARQRDADRRRRVAGVGVVRGVDGHDDVDRVPVLASKRPVTLFSV